MKFSTAFALSAASASFVLAQPHQHGHHHAHPVKHVRDVTLETKLETVVAYELNGKVIPENEVCQGISDGDLKWADGKAPSGACGPTSTAAPTTSAAPTSSAEPSSSAAGAQFYEAPSSAAPSPSPAASTDSGSSSGGSGVDSSFPDGQLSCDSFPSGYGAVPIDYLNMGGWIGIQRVTISGSSISDISTGISGDGCVEGAMCSYACPPGYQKAQWPTMQGATGQSVGGISCSGGKLHLTNSGLSDKLCIAGTGGVKAQNKNGQVVSICRTDYPGTESETVPTVLQSGETEELTCPDGGSYYQWKGMTTSAQYYLNPPGYGASDACKWGDGSLPIGNWAPLNFGVGKKDGTTWLSIMANKPTTNAPYPGTVEITGNISGSCKYENGAFHSLTGSNGDGCTVSLVSGEATYVIS